MERFNELVEKMKWYFARSSVIHSAGAGCLWLENTLQMALHFTLVYLRTSKDQLATLDGQHHEG